MVALAQRALVPARGQQTQQARLGHFPVQLEQQRREAAGRDEVEARQARAVDPAGAVGQVVEVLVEGSADGAAGAQRVVPERGAAHEQQLFGQEVVAHAYQAPVEGVDGQAAQGAHGVGGPGAPRHAHDGPAQRVAEQAQQQRAAGAKRNFIDPLLARRHGVEPVFERRAAHVRVGVDVGREKVGRGGLGERRKNAGLHPHALRQRCGQRCGQHLGYGGFGAPDALHGQRRGAIKAHRVAVDGKRAALGLEIVGVVVPAPAGAVGGHGGDVAISQHFLRPALQKGVGAAAGHVTVQKRRVAGALEKQRVAAREVAQAGQRVGEQVHASVKAEQLHHAGRREVARLVVAKQDLAGGGIGQAQAHLVLPEHRRAIQQPLQPRQRGRGRRHGVGGGCFRGLGAGRQLGGAQQQQNQEVEGT